MAVVDRGAPTPTFGDVNRDVLATLRTPGGQWLGRYELTRPGVDAHFAGRLDFG